MKKRFEMERFFFSIINFETRLILSPIASHIPPIMLYPAMVRRSLPAGFLPFVIFLAFWAPADSVSAQGASIRFGKKEEVPLEKTLLDKARRLSDFYFTTSKTDSAGLRIQSYTVSVKQPGQRSHGPATESRTDFFSSAMMEMLRTAPAESEILFDNVKATSTDPSDHRVQLLSTLRVILKGE